MDKNVGGKHLSQATSLKLKLNSEISGGREISGRRYPIFIRQCVFISTFSSGGGKK